MAINIEVKKFPNSLGIARGLYLDWKGTSLSDAQANTLLGEGAAVLSGLVPSPYDEAVEWDAATGAYKIVGPALSYDTANNIAGLVGKTGKTYYLSRSIQRPLIALAVGNSIVDSYAGYSEVSACFFPTSALMWAKFFAGGIFTQTRLSVGADVNYYDRFGNVGHGGATLDTINNDLSTSGWTQQLSADAVTPDVIMGMALAENDIANGTSYAIIAERLDDFLKVVRAIYPGVLIMLGSPLPSYSYDTTAKQTVAGQVNEYMKTLALNNSYVEYVDQSGYRDSNWQPSAVAYVFEATPTVHPTPKAAIVSGRAWGQAFKRLFHLAPGTNVLSANLGLFGSIPATADGTGVTGTQPTGSIGWSFNVPAGFAVASEALNPGWRFTITQTVLQGPAYTQIPSPNQNNIDPISASSMEVLWKIKIVSGASQLGNISLANLPYYTDSTNENLPMFALRSSDHDYPPDFIDGDELHIWSHRQLTNPAKAINFILSYLTLYKKNVLGSIVIEVESIGTVGSLPYPESQYIPYAATITPDINAGKNITIGTLTGNITINAPINPARGKVISLSFTSDATIGRAITYNAVFKTSAVPTSTANGKASHMFVYDSQNWVQIGGALVWL